MIPNAFETVVDVSTLAALVFPGLPKQQLADLLPAESCHWLGHGRLGSRREHNAHTEAGNPDPLSEFCMLRSKERRRERREGRRERGQGCHHEAWSDVQGSGAARTKFQCEDPGQTR